MIHLPEASAMSGRIDLIYNVILWFSVISFVIVIGLMFVFMFKYSRAKNDPNKTPFIHGHTPTEVGIGLLLLVVSMAFFYFGWVDYVKMNDPGTNPLEINVTARQWAWEYEYQNGRKIVSTNADPQDQEPLVVPMGRPIKLIMTSTDVLHSYYIPNFRFKQDVIPNRFTLTTFTAIKTGDNEVFCAEYCGTLHSKMFSRIKVVDQKEYDQWQMQWEVDQKLGTKFSENKSVENNTEDSKLTPVDKGKAVYAQKCASCHTNNGQPLVGPSLKGLFGKTEEMTDGSKVKVDENYLRESMMQPQLKVVKGFQPIMPTFAGQMSDDEVNHLIAYIKSL